MTAERYAVQYTKEATGLTVHVIWARTYKQLVEILCRMVMWDDEITHLDVHDTKQDYSLWLRWKA